MLILCFPTVHSIVACMLTIHLQPLTTTATYLYGNYKPIAFYNHYYLCANYMPIASENHYQLCANYKPIASENHYYLCANYKPLQPLKTTTTYVLTIYRQPLTTTATYVLTINLQPLKTITTCVLTNPLLSVWWSRLLIRVSKSLLRQDFLSKPSVKFKLLFDNLLYFQIIQDTELSFYLL